MSKTTALSPKHGRLLDVPQAAERLGVNEQMIRRLINERRISFIHIGRLVRIAESDIDAYIEAGTVPASQPDRKSK